MAEYPRPMLECAMQTVTVPSGGFASTQRVDRWWIAPTTTAAGLFLLFGYLTFRAFNPSLTPPSCAVGGVPQRYRGETRLFLIQNLHRYTLYGALFLIACRWWEGLSAFFRNGQFGIGVGTVVMLVNATLLSGYLFGCHSWRHLIGGRLDWLTARIWTPLGCPAGGS